MAPTVVDDALLGWDSVEDFEWPTVLVGNGLSINLWSRFGYGSLFDEARISAPAQDIFTELETTNFETALECIHHSRVVLEALGESSAEVDSVYTQVRDGLFAAVNDAHLPWDEFPMSAHERIAVTLDEFSAVYTTNYDLCLYWSQLQFSDKVAMVDYFWGAGNRFDPDDVSLMSTRLTPIHYLHGAIHLWQDDVGDDGKWTTAEGRLLSVASNYTPESKRRPLFVSEGTSKMKVRTIQRSPYLTFCLDSLTHDAGDLVIFGHSLSEQDQHILQAIEAGPTRRIAVSLYPSDPQRVIADKNRIAAALARHSVHFFDSTTHPLGDPQLNVG